LISAAASASEAAAIVAAVERFLVETAPAPEPVAAPSAWQTAALREGVTARQLTARGWGAASGWRRG